MTSDALLAIITLLFKAILAFTLAYGGIRSMIFGVQLYREEIGLTDEKAKITFGKVEFKVGKVGSVLIGTSFLWAMASVIVIPELSFNEYGKPNITEDKARFEKSRERLSSEIDQLIADLPSPTEIPYLLAVAGVDYDSTLVNDLYLSNISGYNTSEKAAVNLGAYSVDVGYLISYNQSKEVLKYIEGMKILAERFDFESAFNNSDLIYGVNENIDKKELLKDIYSGKLQETNEILNSQFDSKVIIYFTYGQLIESLYIVTSIANEYPEDLPQELRQIALKPYINILADQKIIAKSLMNLIDLTDNSREFETLKSTVDAIYIDLDSIEVSINSGRTLSIANFSSKIRKLRSEIIRII